MKRRLLLVQDRGVTWAEFAARFPLLEGIEDIGSLY